MVIRTKLVSVGKKYINFQWMENRLAEMGNRSVKVKIDIAFLGKFGFGMDVSELKELDQFFYKKAVKLYHQIKQIIWNGNTYYLQNSCYENIASISYVSNNQRETIVFNFYIPSPYNFKRSAAVKMQGLLPEESYQIVEINLYPGTFSPIDRTKTYSGDFLMKVGFNPEVSAKRNSVILKVTAI